MIKPLYGLANGLYNGLPFSPRSALLDTGAKRRLRAVMGHTRGGTCAESIGTQPPTLDGLEGVKKAAPGSPRAGSSIMLISQLQSDHV